MNKWTIYHNPKCSKSRKALEILKENNLDPEVIEYLIEPLNKDELLHIISISEDHVKNFVRTKEEEFKQFSHINLEDKKEVAKLLAENPKLLERPIIVNEKQSIIARPVEKLEKYLIAKL